MRKHLFIILSISLCFLCAWGTAFSQERKSIKQETERVKIEGNIIAYDKLSSLLDITWSSNIQTYILKVNKIIKGSEPELYIIVINKSFDTENKVLKRILNGNKRVRLELNREKNCDASLEEIVQPEGESENQEAISRFEWLDDDTTKPTSKMPCYLIKGGVAFIK